MTEPTYEFRPIGLWTDAFTPPDKRKSSQFKVGYEQTLNELFREAELLGATRLVLQVDLQASQIRGDGLPKANDAANLVEVRHTLRQIVNVKGD